MRFFIRMKWLVSESSLWLPEGIWQAFFLLPFRWAAPGLWLFPTWLQTSAEPCKLAPKEHSAGQLAWPKPVEQTEGKLLALQHTLVPTFLTQRCLSVWSWERGTQSHHTREFLEILCFVWAVKEKTQMPNTGWWTVYPLFRSLLPSLESHRAGTELSEGLQQLHVPLKGWSSLS